MKRGSKHDAATQPAAGDVLEQWCVAGSMTPAVRHALSLVSHRQIGLDPFSAAPPWLQYSGRPERNIVITFICHANEWQ